MRGDRPITPGFDPRDGIGDIFIAHRHRMRIGVDHCIGIHDQRHMAFPEQEVIVLIVTADRRAHGGLLLVAVTGAGDAASE